MSRSFGPEDFEPCERCPWCGAREREPWGQALRGFTTARCTGCDVLFLDRRLTRAAQEAYYAGYLSEVHEEDAALSAARSRMYALEAELVAPHVVRPAGGSRRVLDVGCARGGLLQAFRARGFEGFGVELGAEAAAAAGREFEVWRGELPEFEPGQEFDLVVFRGVIEHVHDPRAYLNTAWELLRSGGVLYITSTPNRDAFCAELFRERWNQHEPEGHLFHLAVRHLDAHFGARGGLKLFERYLYEETPYANPARDVAQVAEALRLREAGERIEFSSPPFWGNLLSVAYRKG